MKKQINPTIKAHLLRSAFYLLLLLAVCAIPFALAQRKTTKPARGAIGLQAQRQLATDQSLLSYDVRPSVFADSVLKHVQFQPAGQAQSGPVLLPHQIEGIDCNSAPGIVIHDDGGIENGYSGNPALVTEVRFADKFTPSSYPATFTSVCLDFVIVAGGPPTYPIDVVVYDDDGAGGSPGTLLGELNGQTATTHSFTGGGQPPVWNSYDISSMGLNITSGSVYIGTRYVPPANNVYTSADESGPVGFAGGYWWNDADGVWSQTQNAFGAYTSMFIRAVEGGGGGGTPTPTPTPGCTWSAGPNLPSVGVRIVGVFFAANGKFYGMGGRSSDSFGSEFTNPFEYDPATNTWTTKSATYPDTHVNNMACGVLTDAGTPYIYCVGGSQVTLPDIFDRVFRYNPVTDVISAVAAPWPGANAGTTLPGGFTVLNNKLYILGGFDTITNLGQGTNQIWEFTPSPAATYPPRPLAASFTPVGAAISRVVFLPIRPTPLFITRWRIRSARLPPYRGRQGRRVRLTSTARCGSWVGVEPLPTPLTRWTSMIRVITPGQRAFHSLTRGATSQPIRMAPTASGWLAAMLPQARRTPWKSSPAKAAGHLHLRLQRHLRRQLHPVAAQSLEASTPAIPRRLIDSSAAVSHKRVQRLRHVRSLVIQLRGITIPTPSPTRQARLSA